MAKHCPKCFDLMQTGVVGGTSEIQRWHSQKDEKIPDDKRMWKKYSFKDERAGQPITAYKCQNCGYVELFAEVY